MIQRQAILNPADSNPTSSTTTIINSKIVCLALSAYANRMRLRNKVEITSPFDHIPQIPPPFFRGDRGVFKNETNSEIVLSLFLINFNHCILDFIGLQNYITVLSAKRFIPI